nr:pho85 cyclin-1 [Quercus suber]
MAYCMSQQNADALEHFIYLPVSQGMISHLADKASKVIRCEGQQEASKPLPPTPPTTPPQRSPCDREIPSLEHFISNLVERSHVQVPTLMTSLVYLARLQQRLPPIAKGMKCTAHRIFLASLILAAKNLNDSSPKNKHWARYTTVAGYDNFGFSLTEVNLMEKQLLGLLEWDLRVTEDDLYFHFEPFLQPIRSYHAGKRAEAEMQLREEQRQIELAAAVAAAEQHRRTAMGTAHYYESPRSVANDYAYRTAYYGQSSCSSSRAPSRTPSLSPPTRSRSKASYSSTDSYHMSASPSSIASSYNEVLADDVPVHIQQYESTNQPALVRIAPGKQSYALDVDPQLSAKKSKPSNIFSRFLPTMTRPQMLQQHVAPVPGY